MCVNIRIATLKKEIHLKFVKIAAQEAKHSSPKKREQCKQRKAGKRTNSNHKRLAKRRELLWTHGDDNHNDCRAYEASYHHELRPEVTILFLPKGNFLIEEEKRETSAKHRPLNLFVN